MDALVGRDSAAATLRRLVDDARAGAGRLVLIAGEAGIGKTALATQISAYAGTGATVVWGVCVDGAPAYWPWPDVLAELGAPPLPDATGADDGWFTAATAIVAALRARAPVVVVLDDLQWAGPGCVRVLEFAARVLRRSPVLLLGTFRDLEVDPGHPLARVLGGADVVTLDGLGEADVASLLRRTAGERAGDLAADVTRRTGGNPFFVEQIGRLLAASPSTAPSLDHRVPVAVGEAVNHRIARLPGPTAALLDAASVVGTDVDAALLATATATAYPDVVSRLDPAVAARVLRPAGLGHYRFEHDLYRETLYQNQDPAVRAGTHRAVGQALADRRAGGADVRLGDIAQHFALAVPAVGAEVASAHVRAAAEDAQARLAHEEAARHWAGVVRLAEVAGGVPAELRLTLADALLRAGDLAGARAAYLAVAAATTGDEVVLGRAAFGVHRCGETSGESHAATIALLDRAAHALDARAGAEPVLTARVRAALARELADGPDADQGRASALVASAVALAEPDAGRPALAFCLMAQHDVEWGPGTAVRRLEIAARMAAAARGDAELEFDAALCRFTALVELADPSAASALRDLEAGALRLAQPRHRYLALSRRAAFSIATGDLAGGRRQLTEARELADAIGEPDGPAVHVTQAMMLGQLTGGADGLGDAAREFPAPAMPPELAPHEHAFRQLADGQPAAAAATLRAAVGPHLAAMFRWRALAEAALVIEIAVAAGAPDLCAIRYRDLAPYAGGFIVIGGVVSILGPVDLYLGLAAAATGDPRAARAHLTEAVSIAERFGAPVFAARAQVELAHVLRALGEDTTAAALALSAGEVADQLGLHLVRDRAVALLHGDRMATATLRRTDQVWTLTFDGVSAQLPDAKGLHDLAALLAVPGQEVSARQLAGVPDPDLGADEVLDERARAAYQARLAALDAEIDAATDADAVRLTAERQALIAELARAYGLGGRVRRLGDLGERARSTVTARLRDTLRRIERVHPALAAHLRASVTTGRSCVYRPDRPVRWSL